MRWILATVMLLGVFTEVRTPRKGYDCLHVKHGEMHYKAIKFERSRLTGQVTLTMKSTDQISPLLGKPARPGRKIQLSGYEAVTDSNQCHCYVFHPRCIDE